MLSRSEFLREMEQLVNDLNGGRHEAAQRHYDRIISHDHDLRDAADWPESKREDHQSEGEAMALGEYFG